VRKNEEAIAAKLSSFTSKVYAQARQDAALVFETEKVQLQQESHNLVEAQRKETNIYQTQMAALLLLMAKRDTDEDISRRKLKAMLIKLMTSGRGSRRILVLGMKRTCPDTQLLSQPQAPMTFHRQAAGSLEKDIRVFGGIVLVPTLMKTRLGNQNADRAFRSDKLLALRPRPKCQHLPFRRHPHRELPLRDSNLVSIFCE